MANEKEIKSANETYNALCGMLHEREWKFEEEESDGEKFIRFQVCGDDIPMDFVIFIDVGRQLIRLISFLPFTIAKDKITDLALATSYINYQLADGSFDFDISDGTISFRMTSCFRESLISRELFAQMVDIACYTVDKYNDMLLMLGKGIISLDDFIKKI